MKTLCLLCLVCSYPVLAVSQGSSSFVAGIDLVGGAGSCPVFVAHVGAGSPAEQAGIKSGDAVVAVDGTPVSSVHEATKLLHSERPRQVTLTLVRQEKPFAAAVGLEKRSTLLDHQRKKVLESGMVTPLDATENEMKRKQQALTLDRFIDRVFPTHYPANENLYYPGFEVLILKNPTQVAVLGIEDGPASQAGVHWGDIILSVNGVDPRNKPVTELESLFSSDKPASMRLKIERAGTTKTFRFQLAEAAQVLRDNQLQVLHGTLVPRGLPERYLHCFK